MRRRRVLAAVGAAVPLALAGCLDGGTGGRDTDGGTVGTASDGTDAAETSGNGTPSGGSTDGDGDRTDWPSGPYADYGTSRVHVRTPEGDRLGTVLAAVARTPDQRYLGLSDADSLPEDGGMLFVYGSPADRTFVMRRMDFGLDIVYADGERAITSIHHAPKPRASEDGTEQRYPGHGQYVLELPYGWTTRHGVEAGDLLEFGL